ncbi:plasmid partitioning protein RepB [Rhodoblastus sphagnicola]|uniref:Plasmid partitioning protein RepB n=1 Tax=Rhodoblastus sphagnicola TaxID=333368 RepID=A0A2S6NF21_9HYPH|nr:plasmid partitioning protein RepB [Rhodoblastus sphagnicola]MBB4200188.1 ParB family chromosome partitioning protein [Rhodoblastus sphagnicola]PPQ33228.1 plasmid partitioning protein RepB [Rhodoblastus sphagnicola]
MARKNLLSSVTADLEPSKGDHEARTDYARRGASRSMLVSIDEMAENAKKMAAGETIVDLDVDVIDGSFVSDRIETTDEDYLLLRDAIKQNGQSTPILVRPHPHHNGRYMIVFGHRRARVAKDLGVPVRAVVKNIEDVAHIIAQGQENAARANLSFIEKAIFAKKLLGMGQSKDTIKAALMIDDTLLSRMLSVAETIPLTVIDALGAAKSIGRDRWEELKKLVAHPANAELACQEVASAEFIAKEASERFNYLLARLVASRKLHRRARPSKAEPASWAADDNLIAASIQNTGKTYSLLLKSKNASEFGRFISSNLDSLYRAFIATRVGKETGD